MYFLFFSPDKFFNSPTFSNFLWPRPPCNISFNSLPLKFQIDLFKIDFIKCWEKTRAFKLYFKPRSNILTALINRDRWKKRKRPSNPFKSDAKITRRQRQSFTHEADIATIRVLYVVLKLMTRGKVKKFFT